MVKRKILYKGILAMLFLLSCSSAFLLLLNTRKIESYPDHYREHSLDKSTHFIRNSNDAARKILDRNVPIHLYNNSTHDNRTVFLFNSDDSNDNEKNSESNQNSIKKIIPNNHNKTHIMINQLKPSPLPSPSILIITNRPTRSKAATTHGSSFKNSNFDRQTEESYPSTQDPLKRTNREYLNPSNQLKIAHNILERIIAEKNSTAVHSASNTIPLTPTRPRNVSRHESPNYPWGKHAFGPVENYLVMAAGTRWKAYFHREAVAVLLEDLKGSILDCTLLEIIPEHEQKVALVTLGKVMPLIPLSLPQMIQLNSFCSTSHKLLPPPSTSKPAPLLSAKIKNPEHVIESTASLIAGILPGTLWCGRGDRAIYAHDLGERKELDRCCRAHDHCPVKLRVGVSRYGSTNRGFYTLCDEAFLTCLKNATDYDEMAEMVGQVFFNILGVNCLSGEDPGLQRSFPKGAAPPSVSLEWLCISTDSERNCRHWIRKEGAPRLKLKITRPRFQFK